MSKRKIAVVTVSRAEYGILKNLLLLLKDDPAVELQLIVTGSHFLSEKGSTISDIEEDGIPIAAQVVPQFNGDQPKDISCVMGQIVQKLGATLAQLQPDMLVVISDRYETLAAAVAAIPFNLPVVHIAGGTTTYGAIDDNIRHATTKLSHLHFPIDTYGESNLKKLGEEAWRIHTVGSMTIDLLHKEATLTKEELKKELGVDFSQKVMLLVHHPVTKEFQDSEAHITTLLAAVADFEGEIVALMPNQDTGNSIIAQKLKQNKHIHLFKHFKRKVYLSLLKHCNVFVGNSSSGILEAPTFKTPFVNIGNRQQGRPYVANVISCTYDIKEIEQAIHKALYDENFLNALATLTNPFGDGHAAQRIHKIIKEIPLTERLLHKKL